MSSDFKEFECQSLNQKWTQFLKSRRIQETTSSIFNQVLCSDEKAGYTTMLRKEYLELWCTGGVIGYPSNQSTMIVADSGIFKNLSEMFSFGYAQSVEINGNLSLVLAFKSAAISQGKNW